MTIPLKGSVVYGPVDSRRLGRSLGINILPCDKKFCAFNCVYCQYGWTEFAPDEVELPGTDRLLDEIEEALGRIKKEDVVFDYLTIAGNGEPTLHPDFCRIVDALIRMRGDLFPDKKIGILSDSYGVIFPDVRRALGKLDLRCMKLDVGSREDFLKINKPRLKIEWADMLAGLRLLKDIIVQSLFVRGAFDNSSDEAVRRWAGLIAGLNPVEVHIYTLDRPPASAGVLSVSRERLFEIKEHLEKLGYNRARVFMRE
ncbi:MAG: radical SAM protein [Candidatus Omnitrophica bacterium]|nr:radical SAM protein [Candidatus Omnitrophota bacterium]